LTRQDEQRRIHAQLAAEQNCEEGMGWPTRMPEDLEIEAMPASEDEEEEARLVIFTPSRSITDIQP